MSIITLDSSSVMYNRQQRLRCGEQYDNINLLNTVPTRTGHQPPGVSMSYCRGEKSTACTNKMDIQGNEQSMCIDGNSNARTQRTKDMLRYTHTHTLARDAKASLQCRVTLHRTGPSRTALRQNLCTYNSSKRPLLIRPLRMLTLLLVRVVMTRMIMSIQVAASSYRYSV
eukprot:scpid25005/ scgid35226/ 